MITCPNCGEMTSKESAFCQNCGASMQVESVSETVENVEKAEAPKKEKKIDKKIFIIIGAAVAAILALVIVIILVLILIGTGKKNNVLYVKDDEIYYTNLSQRQPWQVTENLLNTDYIDSSDLVQYASYNSAYGFIQMSKDGKTVFYMDEIENDDSFNLYYRKVNKSRKNPVKISSDVTSYVLNEKTDIVTYEKEDKLYQYDMKESEKIANDVTAWYVSEDGKTIVYINDDGKAYFKKAGKDKEKIDSDIDYIEHISDDFKTVYYLKEDKLYMKKMGKDKVKIASDVFAVEAVYDNGDVYFLKDDSKEVTLMDYVKDDMKEADDKLEEPEYPNIRDFSTYEEYWDAQDAYWDAYYEYDDKEERDELREELESEKMTIDSYELYYYNGKEAKSVAKNVNNYDVDAASERPVIVYSVVEPGDVSKVKLSEIDYIWEVEDMIEDAMQSDDAQWSVAVKANASKVDVKEADYFELSKDGNTVYFMAKIDSEDSHGNLYKASISSSKMKKVEKYDSDVYYRTVGFVGEDFAYFKDVDDDDNVGVLVVNKKKVDDDVYLYRMTYDKNKGDLYYMVDWDSDDYCGVLCRYNGSKAKELVGDVYRFCITEKSEVVYLCDYSTEKDRGDLYLYKSRKPKKIDEDVLAIITLPTHE